MDLRNYSDEQLLKSTWQLACADRRLITALLHHLNEIALRRLYARESYPSLFEYCVKCLKFTDAQAQTRIWAARLLRDIPEAEEKIIHGHLTLSAACQVQVYFNKNKIPLEERKKFLPQLENKSSREVKKFFRAIDPKSFREIVTPISAQLTEFRFAANEELTGKLTRLKNVLHTKTLEELMVKMADATLQKYDPLKKAERNLKVAERRNASLTSKVTPSRHIPAQVRHQVWLRDKGTCTHPGCGSQYGLELDHIILYAHGGQHTTENLRLRCRAHNQLHAENELGRKKMSAHWQS